MGKTKITRSMSIKSIQEALKKGGEFIFEGGIYNITDTLYLYSNTTITLSNDTVLQRKKAVPVFQTYVNKDTTKYDGQHDIKITGGTIKCNGATKRTNIVNLIHASNIKLANIKFIDGICHHFIEINACRDVTVDKCTFDNYDVDEENPFREAVQYDFAMYAALKYIKDKNAKCYDGTHSKNITVSNCIFNDVLIAVGTHTQTRKTNKHTNIKIINNTMSGLGMVDKYGSAIKLLNVRVGLVSGNQISNFARGIEITTLTKSYNNNGTTVSTLQKGNTGCEDIEITNNKIVRPSKDAKSSGVYIKSAYEKLVHKNIIIKRNVFQLKNGVSKYAICTNCVEELEQGPNTSDI